MSTFTNTAVVILAAGHGTRMKSAMPKVLHPVGGLPMLGHVIAVARAVCPKRLCVVIGDQAPEVGDAAKAFHSDTQIFVQSPPRGTGDAVICALPGLDSFAGVIFILYADTPLITTKTLEQMAAAVSGDIGVAVLGFTPEDPGAYGRLILAEDGSLEKIVEAKDASSDELAVSLCNSGVMAIRSDILSKQLPRMTNDNAKGEYYLTDLVGLARAAGDRACVIRGDEAEVLGVNSRVELAEAEALFQDRMRQKAMLSGVTLNNPETVYFSHDTKISQDVTIAPNVVFGPGVTLEQGAQIKAFSHLEGVQVKANAAIGPFARLRPGTIVGEEAKIGNFVEIKKTSLGKRAKISHLSYVGDAEIGADANIGAGTITCNYDGYKKYQTIIGDGAFIGSNSALVAPVTVGPGAYVGSGSVITKNVEKDALAVARGRQIHKLGWALSFRKKMS